MATIHPIQFAFPTAKLPSSYPEKVNFFSDLSPLGRAKKYKFFAEDEYYAHYAKSYFGVTMKKGGWDCLRHYEILASNTLPYFINIEQCPPNTLFAWPKKLLNEVKNMPGMPSERNIISAVKKGTLDKIKMPSKFNQEHYTQLHKEFTEHFKTKLTTHALSNYVLEKLKLKPRPRILLCFGATGSALDYMRDLLIAALGSDDRISLTLYPNPFWHLNSCHRQILNTLYGRGFTCTATLSPTSYQSPSWSEIKNEIESFDAIIACSASNNGFASLPEEVQNTLASRHDIVWVDGNDIKADHSIPDCAKVVFRREMN